MRKKHSVLTFILFLFGISILLNNSSAFAAQKGQVTFSLAIEDKKIEQYQKNNQDGAGVYVFVKNIDTKQVYRFPMNQANDYVGTFQINYGNYQVIPNPEAKQNELVVKTDTVFTVSDTVPIVEVKCYLEQKETETQKKESTPLPQINTSKETKKSAGNWMTFQKIFTILAFVAIAGIWIYNRFIKYHIGFGNNHLDDD